MAGPGLTPSGNIVEVNNVPTDHQPNPRTEDVRIGRLDGVGHETRLVRYLPPSRERICTLRHKKILRAPSQDMKESNPQAEGLAQWPNSFWTAPSASIRDEAEEKEYEGRGQGSSNNRARTQTKKKSPPAKRTVVFLDAKRFEPDVGYRPVEGDHKNEGSAWAAGPSNYRQTNVSMVPAEIEALPESEVLVSNPPPNCEYTIIAEVLSDYMRHNQGMAIAFRLLGQKMADRDFDCKRDVGIVKMKYMLIKARSHIGFGWTDDADAGASWVWLWDAEKPYRAPLCPTEQWQAFRASRSGWEPPGLKEGMGNVMRGGAGLKPPRKEASKAHWATVARGWERERDLGREAERKRERDWVEERGSSSRSAISCGRERDGERDSRASDRQQDRERERERDRGRGPRHIDSDRDRDRSRDRDHYGDRDQNRDRDRNWDRSPERDRNHDRDRDRNRDYDRSRNRDRERGPRHIDSDRDRDRSRDRDRDRSRDERGRDGPGEEERNWRRGGNGSDSYPAREAGASGLRR